MHLRFKLHEHVFIKQVDKVAVAYSSLSNEMVVLHPLTQAILALLEQPMSKIDLIKAIEDKDVEGSAEIVLKEFVYATIDELDTKGFVQGCK